MAGSHKLLSPPPTAMHTDKIRGKNMLNPARTIAQATMLLITLVVPVLSQDISGERTYKKIKEQLLILRHGIPIERAPTEVKELAVRPYDELLGAVGDYISSTWKIDTYSGRGEKVSMTRVPDNALALAVNPETDGLLFVTYSFAAAPKLAPIPTPTSTSELQEGMHIYLAKRVMERIKPILSKVVCREKGISEELNNIKLRDLVIGISVVLGISAARGRQATIPTVVVAVTAIIVKSGIKEYCLLTGWAKILSVSINSNMLPSHKLSPGIIPCNKAKKYKCFMIIVKGKRV